MAVVESRDIFGRVSCAQGISEFWKEKSMQENRIDAFERKLDAGLVLSIVATGIMSFSGVCVETAMNVTFPTLMREFGVNTATVQWLTTAYLLVLAAVVPVSGFLNRRFKTKHVFCFAMAFYIVGIVCGMTAQVFPALLLGRVLEGIGTGVALPLMFNIITEQAPQERLGLMMGIGSLVTAVAPAVGPSVGGWLSETFGWRAIFAALLPLLLVAFVLGISSIRQSHEVPRESFDFPGWLCLAASFTCLVFVVDEGANIGWTSPAILGLFVAFVVFLALFVYRERSCEAPLIHLDIFGHRGYVFGLGVAVFFAVYRFGPFVFAAVFCPARCGRRPDGSGFYLAVGLRGRRCCLSVFGAVARSTRRPLSHHAWLRSFAALDVPVCCADSSFDDNAACVGVRGVCSGSGPYVWQ